MSYRSCAIILTLALWGMGLSPLRADDADMVKEKLSNAKKDYDAEMQKFRKAVNDLLDKREDSARNAGNKKAVDQVKVEREAFDKKGDCPPMVPSSIRDPLSAARTKLDKAYTAAIKDYLRLKMDDEAGSAEKEQKEFKLSSTLLFGKRAYLVSLKHFDVKPAFANDGYAYVFGKQLIKIDGEPVPHSIFAHPPDKGYSQVCYPLGGKWTVFRSSIGVPNHEVNTGDPKSPLTFEVIGDGKSLWKSEPVTKRETFQNCTINVEKIKTLTLRVHCEDSCSYAWAFWFEPIIVE